MHLVATAEQASAFIEAKGIVLASTRGAVPNLAEEIVGEPVRGSWWSHPRGRDLFRIFHAVDHDPDVLVCRLVDGKVTYVHRRLWPALARLADRLPAERVARVRQEHTKSGRHVNRIIPFPDWMPAGSIRAGKTLSEDEALCALGGWVTKGMPQPVRSRA